MSCASLPETIVNGAAARRLARSATFSTASGAVALQTPTLQSTFCVGWDDTVRAAHAGPPVAPTSRTAPIIVARTGEKAAGEIALLTIHLCLWIDRNISIW